jgi:hypothetical protein
MRTQLTQPNPFPNFPSTEFSRSGRSERIFRDSGQSSGVIARFEMALPEAPLPLGKRGKERVS